MIDLLVVVGIPVLALAVAWTRGYRAGRRDRMAETGEQ